MRRSRLRYLVRVLVLTVSLLTIWVWQRITVVKTVRANDLLRARVLLKQETVNKVSAEISRLRRHARIEKIATERLGLVPTHPTQRRIIPGTGTTKDEVEEDGWQRFNNSLKRLSAAAATSRKGSKQTP